MHYSSVCKHNLNLTTSVLPEALNNPSWHYLCWVNINKYKVLRCLKVLEQIIKAVSRDILCIAKIWRPKNVLRPDKR